MTPIRPLLLAALLCGSAAAADLRPFDAGSFAKIRAAHAGHPLVVHVWGLTCGPCLKELPRWGDWLREAPNAPVVLVEFDAVPLASIERQLQKARLANGENWAVTEEPDEYLRASLDPRWAGDMPRTLLITADGKVTALRGVADVTQVREWLRKQPILSPG
jgi:thiol-disulfide isomerase/thioredoxin